MVDETFFIFLNLHLYMLLCVAGQLYLFTKLK